VSQFDRRFGFRHFDLVIDEAHRSVYKKYGSIVATRHALTAPPSYYPSPMTDLFLHNPRCSKSRAALELVRVAGVELPVREYLREPLSVDELRRIVGLLGVRPIEIVRRGEAEYAALGLSDATPDEEVLRAMAKHPILIERPILVRGDRAVVGRPPELVRDLL
jgi:arsenate reductase (glutaredoxin)